MQLHLAQRACERTRVGKTRAPGLRPGLSDEQRSYVRPDRDLNNWIDSQPWVEKMVSGIPGELSDLIRAGGRERLIQATVLYWTHFAQQPEQVKQFRATLGAVEATEARFEVKEATAGLRAYLLDAASPMSEALRDRVLIAAEEMLGVNSRDAFPTLGPARPKPDIIAQAQRLILEMMRQRAASVPDESSMDGQARLLVRRYIARGYPAEAFELDRMKRDVLAADIRHMKTRKGNGGLSALSTRAEQLGVPREELLALLPAREVSVEALIAQFEDEPDRAARQRILREIDSRPLADDEIGRLIGHYAEAGCGRDQSIQAIRQAQFNSWLFAALAGSETPAGLDFLCQRMRSSQCASERGSILSAFSGVQSLSLEDLESLGDSPEAAQVLPRVALFRRDMHNDRDVFDAMVRRLNSEHADVRQISAQALAKMSSEFQPWPHLLDRYAREESDRVRLAIASNVVDRFLDQKEVQTALVQWLRADVTSKDVKLSIAQALEFAAERLSPAPDTNDVQEMWADVKRLQEEQVDSEVAGVLKRALERRTEQFARDTLRGTSSQSPLIRQVADMKREIELQQKGGWWYYERAQSYKVDLAWIRKLLTQARERRQITEGQFADVMQEIDALDVVINERLARRER
jgi:hypothetical protein